MGYLPESMKACQQITALLAGSPDGPSSLAAVAWPRHGFVELVVEMPFFLVGHWLGGGSPAAESALLSFELSVLSAGICALLFLWVLRLTGNAGWALLLSVGAAFGTMIWPYAYIGLEPTQSFFLLLAGFIALTEPEGRVSRGRTLALAIALAVAVSVKSNGIFLLPVALLLAFLYLRGAGHGRLNERRDLWAHALLIALVVIGLLAANRVAISAFWVRFSGNNVGYLRMVAEDWLAVPFNFFSFFGSINKSVLIFAPITAMALWLAPRAWREARGVTAFALLTLLGMAGGMSLTYTWADELWGPRYLHVAVAPLILLVAVAWGREPLRLGRKTVLAAALVVGFLVSSLGSLFYYGALARAATMAAQSTVENFQYGPDWNHIRFNARLFDVWLGRPVLGLSAERLWTPEQIWLFRMAPPDAPAWKTVDLGPLAQPQPALIRYWRRRPPDMKGWWFVFPLGFGLGVILLGTLVVRVRALPGRTCGGREGPDTTFGGVDA